MLIGLIVYINNNCYKNVFVLLFFSRKVKHSENKKFKIVLSLHQHSIIYEQRFTVDKTSITAR